MEIQTRRGVADNERKTLEISVSDTGCGIEKGQMNKVHEPFYTTKEKGTGLGLAIVDRIVASHGGEFRIESEPGEGTRCTIVLPAEE